METPELDLVAIASRLNAALADCGWRADVTFADDCLSVQLSGEPIAPSENPIDPLAEAIAPLRASDLGTVYMDPLPIAGETRRAAVVAARPAPRRVSSFREPEPLVAAHRTVERPTQPSS